MLGFPIQYWQLHGVGAVFRYALGVASPNDRLLMVDSVRRFFLLPL